MLSLTHLQPLQAFYCYMVAACLQQLERHQEACAMFNRIATLPVLKIQNGRIPVDIFVARRYAQRVGKESVDLPLAHLEVSGERVTGDNACVFACMRVQRLPLLTIWSPCR